MQILFDILFQLINIMIGPNDFCSSMCWIPAGSSSILEKHREELTVMLRIFKKHLPRTLVSVIPPPNLLLLADLQKKSMLCSITNQVECSCLFAMRFRNKRKEFSDVMMR